MNSPLQTALANIKRAPFQALSAISVLSITFFVGTLLAVIVYVSNQIIQHFETKPQIIAFLNDDSSAQDVSLLQSKLSSDPRIKDVHYESKEGALKIYKEATADNPLLSELVSPSIFPASIEFSVSDLSFADQVIQEVKAEEIVDQIGFTASIGGEASLQGTIEKIRQVSTNLRLFAVAMAAILFVTSFLVLLVIISMRMASRKEEVEILRLIGAKPGFIRAPIVLEALVYSSLGVFIGWVIVFITLLYASPTLIQFFQDIKILPRETTEFVILFAVIFAVELAIGTFLALVGTYVAISRVKNPRVSR